MFAVRRAQIFVAALVPLAALYIACIYFGAGAVSPFYRSVRVATFVALPLATVMAFALAAGIGNMSTQMPRTGKDDDELWRRLEDKLGEVGYAVIRTEGDTRFYGARGFPSRRLVITVESFGVLLTGPPSDVKRLVNEWPKDVTSTGSGPGSRSS